MLWGARTGSGAGAHRPMTAPATACLSRGSVHGRALLTRAASAGARGHGAGPRDGGLLTRDDRAGVLELWGAAR